MNPKKENPIPESKLKSVKELTELIKNKKTILIASIKNIPASQFQKIGKKLRSKAIIKVPKKNLIFRALDSSETEAIKKRYKVFGPPAMLFFDTHGKMRKDLNFYGFREPDEFIEILNKI